MIINIPQPTHVTAAIWLDLPGFE